MSWTPLHTVRDREKSLPPFDMDRPCAKCAGVATVRYVADSGCREVYCSCAAEHMARHCTRCGYEWAEAPLPEKESS